MTSWQAVVIETPDQICRLCLSQDSLDDVFKERDLHRWIVDYLSIMISIEDNISQAICEICRIRLTEFHQFRTHCQEVQDVLKSSSIPLIPDESEEVEKAGTSSSVDNATTPIRQIGEVIQIDAEHQCDVCQKVFSRRKHLYDHKRTHAPRKHLCIHCGKSFTQRRILYNHMKTHAKKKRDQEETSDPNAKKKRIVKTELTSFKCPTCQKECRTRQKWNVHNRSVHKPKKHVCQICDYHGCSKANLARHVASKQHLKKVEELSEFKPGVVVKTEPEDTYEDEDTYDGNDTFSGIFESNDQPEEAEQLIDMEFEETIIKTEKVELDYYSTDPSSMQLNDDGDQGGEEQLQCDPCQKVFSDRRKMKDHMRLVHGVKKYPCPICGKRYALPSQMQLHAQSHDKGYVKPLKCDKCKKSYKHIDSLRAHRYTHHGLGGLVCPTCGKRFAFKSRLERHLATHKSTQDNAEKPAGRAGKLHDCDVCKRTFSSSANLGVHKRQMHPTAKHKCPKCEKGFIYEYQLHSHLRIHERLEKAQKEKEKNLIFKCDICQNTFPQKRSLKFHMKFAHGTKPYKCHMCDLKFLWRCRLELHVGRHHFNLNKNEDLQPMDGEHV